jgi:hypothetical protein
MDTSSPRKVPAAIGMPMFGVVAVPQPDTDVYINVMPPEDAARSLRGIDTPLKV